MGNAAGPAPSKISPARAENDLADPFWIDMLSGMGKTNENHPVRRSPSRRSEPQGGTAKPRRHRLVGRDADACYFPVNIRDNRTIPDPAADAPTPPAQSIGKRPESAKRGVRLNP